ncbi:unnamed protein product [Phytophthora fragariaefolia]|uniref:Unnamed protein product n=1 Tax=Phytophthora fragariaefolia TaxID=1490495 RepID=A0A9W6U304_9STRA|nr:unnamed protein product [Phytophthora fragariaefolia]
MEAVHAMLEVVGLQPGETLVDIGSGDGRVVIEAAVTCPELKKARGVELDEALVGLSRRRIIERAAEMERGREEAPEENCRGEKICDPVTALRERVEIVHADFMKVDMRDADAVILFFLPHEDTARTLQQKLRPGARVVTYVFQIAQWKPHKVVSTVPFMTDKGSSSIYLYRVPPQNSTSKPINKHSECSASFINPRDMPEKCAHAPPENLVERNMLRQGLSYDLIFEHGRPHIPSVAKQKIKFTPTSHDYGSCLPDYLKSSGPSNESDRRRQLELKRARETRDQRTTYLSTSQAIIPVHSSLRR